MNTQLKSAKVHVILKQKSQKMDVITIRYRIKWISVTIVFFLLINSIGSLEQPFVFEFASPLDEYQITWVGMTLKDAIPSPVSIATLGQDKWLVEDFFMVFKNSTGTLDPGKYV